ncbi:DEAD/DEAH box helicase family protein [Nitrosomonas nitrosa]|uniref:DEAD/DEAH box helicase family protein n=1 Tax=Nitrosomonas nitrosa TaxID=52442 RepID=UPI0023F7C6C1|nr:DEAD/DEAH box helicase family protein [Nitrosomonas nitrosa]MCO6435004.1 DEAD/DEAH box helicase family protein [Nitrosomonas nitrosa]
MAHFADKLVLTRWALAQFGVEDFERISTMLKAPEFEGWAEDGGTKYVQQLVTRLPKARSLSDDQLREYDGNIVSHWKHITRHRNLQGQTLYPLYFQYLGLLVTELYLDRYFRDRDGLVVSLNVSVDSYNRDVAQREQFAYYTTDDLNKLAFWMATGSGKTLLMHCHIRQYLHYLGKAGRRQELNRIILLTPNEGLSRQHKEEFELSGIEAEFYDRQGGTLFTGRGVDIIDIHKLRETSGEKTVAVDTFEGNNLVLVDEGHRGSGGEEWMEKRARLCTQGFSFEYSATFGQAIKAASGAKQKALTQTYAKCILFDYSYKYFYDDGYGKDFNILNLAEEREEETRPLYLTACLLAFYQQCRRFADGGSQLVSYLLEAPLMVFVGGSVIGQRQVQEDTDLVLILKFLAAFITNRAESERRLYKLLARQDGLVAGGQRIFERLFPYMEKLYKPQDAAVLFSDILRYVFNAPGGGQLHIMRLMGAEGEIGLRVGENEWFGVVNVGDAKKLCDLCAERKGENEHYVVEELSFSGSLFEEIKRPSSTIRLLAGAKKFTEGWSSWRVSAMGLMNVGRKEGSEIIQLFGRGVRLKGLRFKLKRSSALDALDIQGDENPVTHPEHIELLETLNIFGIRSDYMKEFEEYLEEEGVGEDERREVIFLPTIKLPEFDQEKIRLHVIRPKAEMPDFKKTVRLKLDSLEGKLNNKVIADWYPRLQKRTSLQSGGVAAVALNQEVLRNEHIVFLSWENIWFELERYKRDKAYYNIVFSLQELRDLFKSSWWYELFIPPGYLEFRGLDQRPLWQDIAVHLLKGYIDRFYQFHKREFEAPYLEYQILRPTDDLVLKQYQVLVKKSEKKLIERLRELAAKFKDGEFEAFSFDKLSIFQAAHHLYQPLIHLSHNGGEDSLVKIVPTHLNEGEKRFVDDLEAVCKAEANGMLADIELYLLRNHSSDKAIGFFTESGFRPDFILWLIKDNKQTVVFLDPKGMRNFSDNFNNPKVRFAHRIKELQINPQLKRDDIRLESFLLSQTHRHDLWWPKPGVKGAQADADDYRQHHILFALDDPMGYVREMISMSL